MAFLDKNHPRLSHARQCVLLSVNLYSTYYKAKKGTKPAGDLANEIQEIWKKDPVYGPPRIQAQLTRQGVMINHKRVQRLMNNFGLQAIYPGPKTSKRDLGKALVQGVPGMFNTDQGANLQVMSRSIRL